MYGSVDDEKRKEEDEEELARRRRDEIVRSSLVWRMCFYGFLKNMKFFEAFLLLILMHWGLNLYQIGLLSSVQYFFAYVCEIPAGALADHCGLKRVLLFSFSCYVASYGLYALGQHYGIHALVPAAAVYGVGEAGRSGTHKAMIYRFLDKRGMIEEKAFIYSRTRSFSNLGSAVNAVASVLLVIHYGDNYAMLFVASAIPMVLDFIMVATYPAYMNETPEKKRSPLGIFADTTEALRVMMTTGRSRRAVLGSSMFLALYTSLKHYVQPIVKVHGFAMIVALRPALDREGATAPLDVERDKKILLGCIYAVFYVVSAIGTRNAWRLKTIFRSPKQAMDALFAAYLVMLLVIAFALYHHAAVAVIPIYLVIFLIQNLWKPWGVAGIASLLGKSRRALALSSESLLKTMMQFVLAPAVGYVADRYSLDETFAGFGIVFVILQFVFALGDWDTGSDRSVMPSTDACKTTGGLLERGR